LEEVRRCLDLGLSGVKLHPDKHGLYWLSGPMMKEVMAAVEAAPNVFLDTSQTVDHPKAIFVVSTARLGPGRVLFGSDAPVVSPR
jgi:predicted TIM-barrel fold metal-dependent hydrolase